MTNVSLNMGEGIDRPHSTKKLPEAIPYLEQPIPAVWKTVIEGIKERIPCSIVRTLNDGYVTIRLETGSEFTAKSSEVHYA